MEDADSTSSKPFQLVGLESISLYEENLTAYKKTMKISVDAATLLKLIEKGLDRVSRKELKGNNRKLWEKVREFRSGKLALDEYVKFLLRLEAPNKNYKNLNLFFEVLTPSDVLLPKVFE